MGAPDEALHAMGHHVSAAASCTVRPATQQQAWCLLWLTYGTILRACAHQHVLRVHDCLRGTATDRVWQHVPACVAVARRCANDSCARWQKRCRAVCRAPDLDRVQRGTCWPTTMGWLCALTSGTLDRLRVRTQLGWAMQGRGEFSLLIAAEAAREGIVAPTTASAVSYVSLCAGVGGAGAASTSMND